MEPVPHWFKGCLRITFRGLLWVARNGSPWRDLPMYFGHWNSVCTRCRDWTKAGVVQKILKAVPDDAGMEYAMVRRHGGPGSPPRQGRKRGTEKQVIGRSVTGWSTRIITMTDVLGNLVRFTLIPSQHYDTVGVAPLPEPPDLGGFLPTGRLTSAGSQTPYVRKASGRSFPSAGTALTGARSIKPCSKRGILSETSSANSRSSSAFPSRRDKIDHSQP
ncbi:transposase [Gluconacetobacter entanii]|uniref:transposase n=1 Tax=Gluconacetobacter entanii TaxID=108528 RepID=UPI001ABEEAF7|nr:transposase [Komagataeibacter sp. FNDCR1]